MLGISGTTTNYIWLRTNTTFGINASTLRAIPIPSTDANMAAWWTVVFTPVGADIYRNGVKLATYTSDNSIGALKITNIGASYSSAGFSFDGEISDVYVHSWPLLSGMVRDLHKDPYQFLIPA